MSMLHKHIRVKDERARIGEEDEEETGLPCPPLPTPPPFKPLSSPDPFPSSFLPPPTFKLLLLQVLLLLLLHFSLASTFSMIGLGTSFRMY